MHSYRWLVAIAASLLVIFGLSTAAPAMAGTGPVTKAAPAAKVAPAKRAAMPARAHANTALSPHVSPPLPAGTKRACADPSRISQEQCMLLLHGAGVGKAAGQRQSAAAPVTGALTPSQLQAAYNLTSVSASGGAGVTVAITDAYGDPDLTSDLATYRSQYGLPACDTTTGDGCLTIVNETGGTSLPTATDPSGGWEAEQAADVEMVSAICPLCKITMVEADSTSTADLGTAVNTAAGLAKFVSNSWGGFDQPTEQFLDEQYFDHPGDAVVFASGDAGYGSGYPAASQLVTSVGGTSLAPDSSVSRGFDETVWNDSVGATASGCSAGDAKPSWQADTGCANRTLNDVSAAASGPEGLSIYDSFLTCAGNAASWCSGYGTSLSTPIITAVYALAGTPAANTYPSSYLYQAGHAADFHQITSGSNGTCEPNRLYLCNAADSLSSGFNGPAGWGTPNGVAGFQDTATGNIVSPYNPGGIDIQQGIPYTSPFDVTDLTAKDSASQAVTFTLDGGMPPGLSLSSAGAISGTPSGAGTWTVTVTAKDTSGAAATIAFNIGVAASLDTQASYHPGVGPVTLDWGGKCMDDAGDSSTNGTKIQIWGCNGGASQKWAFYPDTDPGDAGEVAINGKCLDIKGLGTANGSLLDLWDCTGGVNQQWYLVGAAGELYNPASGRCIDDPFHSTSNGAQIDIWDCNGQPWQAWTPAASPVMSGVNGKCVDDTNGANANGNKIQLYNCNGLATQRWTLGLNYQVMINGKCLDATGNGTLNGTGIQLWSCTGGANQQWVPTGYGALENVNAEKCLADPGNSGGNGQQLVLEDCYGDQGEVWAES